MPSLSASEIVLEYVCPSLGVIVANMMFGAPMRDLQKAVSEGRGLGDLNPTPWAFMLGNCLGWSTYGVLISNWFVFWANYPGFLFACWLNLGAVKLMYSSHHGEEARRSMIRYLSQKDFSAEQSRSLVRAADREGGDNDIDIDNVNVNDDVLADPSASPEGSHETSTTAQDWAKIVWDVTSQTTPAKTPHERLVMGMIVLWTVVLTIIGFYNNYTQSDDSNNSNDNDDGNGITVGQTVVGYVVNANLVFFYGAPLSSIFRVLRTRSSGSLHVPTMVMNTCNASFWTAYALAPQIRDPFIWVPNGLGVVLGATQLALWVIFPTKGNGGGDDDSDGGNGGDGDGDGDGSKPRSPDEEAPTEDTSASDERSCNNNNSSSSNNNNNGAIANC